MELMDDREFLRLAYTDDEALDGDWGDAFGNATIAALEGLEEKHLIRRRRNDEPWANLKQGSQIHHYIVPTTEGQTLYDTVERVLRPLRTDYPDVGNRHFVARCSEWLVEHHLFTSASEAYTFLSMVSACEEELNRLEARSDGFHRGPQINRD